MNFEEAKKNEKLSIFQRQALIKLTEKRTETNGFIKNCRPISLLHVDYKIMSKALATKLKETLSDLISCQQTAYVKSRFIGEGCRLISDVLETSIVLNLRGYIVTADIKKAFDSVSNSILLVCLKKFGFGHDFIRLFTVLLESQESCIISAGITTSYSSLEKRCTLRWSSFCISFYFMS